ncbi:hypothetical protein [Leptolyngbya sp. 7M]|uniref:hypothetical protein n=1 Tax=Leptolyngbya sp. 7M TaxID=2812896 RepID=UPI001B8AA5E0|nr:hypothetical protein [Leptolyngbya sp. 7M]QYO67465.1 hypothetical protein JVX88_12120 [Leptolyngbya sp. 7M]
MQIGSRYLGNRQCAFTVWAPQLKQVAVRLVAPEDKLIPLQQDAFLATLRFGRFSRRRFNR